MINKSVFCFFLCNGVKKVKSDSNSEISVPIGRHNLYTDKSTPVQRAQSGDREIIIFGYAVDVFSGQCDNLARTILESTSSFADVIDYEKSLAVST